MTKTQLRLLIDVAVEQARKSGEVYHAELKMLLGSRSEKFPLLFPRTSYTGSKYPLGLARLPSLYGQLGLRDYLGDAPPREPAALRVQLYEYTAKVFDEAIGICLKQIDNSEMISNLEIFAGSIECQIVNDRRERDNFGWHCLEHEEIKAIHEVTTDRKEHWRASLSGDAITSGDEKLESESKPDSPDYTHQEVGPPESPRLEPVSNASDDVKSVVATSFSPKGFAELRNPLVENAYLDALSDFAASTDAIFQEELPSGRATTAHGFRGAVIRLSKRLESVAERFFDEFAGLLNKLVVEAPSTENDSVRSAEWRDAVLRDRSLKIFRAIDAVWTDWLSRVRELSGDAAYGERVRGFGDLEFETITNHGRRMQSMSIRVAERYSISLDVVQKHFDVHSEAVLVRDFRPTASRSTQEESPSSSEKPDSAFAKPNSEELDPPCTSVTNEETADEIRARLIEERAHVREAFMATYKKTRTVSAIATAGAITPSSLYRWLDGTINLAPENRSKLAQVLKVSVDDVPN